MPRPSRRSRRAAGGRRHPAPGARAQSPALSSLDDLAHVGACRPGRAAPSGARALRPVSVDGQLLVLQQPQQHSGIDAPERVAITRPSSGVKPIVVSSELPSLIAHSDAPAPRWQLTIRRPEASCSEQLGRAPRDPGVREAVKAVAAQPPALAPLCRQRVGRGGGGDGGVEGGVKACDGGQAR